MNNKYFYLYACCLLTKGCKRSTIVDVQRGQVFFIPNSLYSILEICQIKTIKEINDSVDQNEILGQYFDFLINNELGLFVDSLDEFSEINLNYESPRTITNAIIEVSDKYNFIEAIEQLEQLNCEALELRFINQISKTELETILDTFEYSSFRSITLILPFSNEFSNEKVEVLSRIHSRVKKIFIYNSPFNKKIRLESIDIYFNDQKNIEISQCGQIGEQHFSPNLDMIKESQCYNSCLNKKISITYEGEIKNCPSMDKSWGNIKNTKLMDILKNNNLKDFWTIQKDQIDVCKDCEFRYICLDCRVFIKDKTNIYSQPSKCGYNPYIAKWEKEDGFISIEEYKKML